MCYKELFKDQLEEVYTYSDGGSVYLSLKDGSKIYLNNIENGLGPTPEYGQVVIVKDGSYEVFNPQGEKIGDEKPNWSGFPWSE